jgi:hypothetical protein
MRILLLFSLLLISTSTYAGEFLRQLNQHHWHTVVAQPSMLGINLLAIGPGGGQVMLVKPTTHWDEKYQADQWYDRAEGSAYFFGKEKIAIYVFDLAKRGISSETKSQLLEQVFVGLNPSEFKSSKLWRNLLIPKAHASTLCSMHTTGALTQFGQQLAAYLPAQELEIWEMLSQCGSTVIQDTLSGLAEMVSDPLKFIGDTWDSIKALSLIVTNFTTILPEIYAQASKLTARQLFDIICPVATKMLISVMTGKIALDGAKIAAQMVKEIKFVQQAASKIKTATKITKLPPRPKLAPLTLKDGERFLEGTKEIQKKAITTLKDGDLLVDGKPLNPSSNYTGVMLQDGRMLMQPRTLANHNQLVMPGDKVATAFEIVTNSKGKVLVLINQSGSFQPKFDDMKAWLDWWAKSQKVEGDLPFRIAKFPGSD